MAQKGKILTLNLVVLLLNAYYISGQSLTLLSNINISWTRNVALNSDTTSFIVSTSLGNGVSVTNAWLGIGLNNNPRMVRFHF